MFIHQHSSPTEFLSAAYPYLKDEEASANIVLAHAWKLRTSSENLANGEPQLYVVEDTGSPSPPSSLWITVWVPNSQGRSGVALKLVLTCVRGELGNYPIFLWMARGRGQFSEVERDTVIENAARQLASSVDPRRVFSIFGELLVVKKFESVWTMLTGYQTFRDPYYHAVSGKCTAGSLSKLQDPLPVGDTIRLARWEDIDAVTLMCKEFSKTSHFPLGAEKAATEAGLLISRNQLFLYESKNTIVSVCAITRATENVAAVTMVYTPPKFRNHGSAERLVHYATTRTLTAGKKSAVVLYVGVHNSARKMYDRIGFTGLYQKPGVDLEEALELGFIGTEKGHW
ncbi:hypothetical protein V5O48_005274 [Marasmius crinis-equi]|uniref:N-acetyltransferase domain-containing protein n=1 Tax=Marasmius crinis-equi TaxID=585013 RepID=A0ABR3FMZ4_9AGAR